MLMHCFDLEMGGVILLEYCHSSDVQAWRVGSEYTLAHQHAHVDPICDLGILEDLQVDVGLSHPQQYQINFAVPPIIYLVCP